MDEPKKTLHFALENYPERVELLPLSELVLDSARQNAKRPAYLKMAVPDDLVRHVRSPRPGADLYLLVRVPGDIGERAESRIVLPGEV